jgi:hypothetical protein
MVIIQMRIINKPNITKLIKYNIIILVYYMNLAKSIVDLYSKYKKPLALLVLVVFVYKILQYFIPLSFKDPFSNSSVCTVYTNCSQCVQNYNKGDPNVPCFWSNDKDKYGTVKGCSAIQDPGFYRKCTDPTPTPTKCEAISNCQTCTSSDCFWGDRDQKCSSTSKSGYGKVCSGSNPPCPKCEVCPKLTLLKTPTFITQQ